MLIKNSNFKYIFLSYNNEGLMSENDVANIMKEIESRNYKINNNFEYLHILEKA